MGVMTDWKTLIYLENVELDPTNKIKTHLKSHCLLYDNCIIIIINIFHI